jgi:hypothetical protein
MACNSAFQSLHPHASPTQLISLAEAISLTRAQAKIPPLGAYLRVAARSVVRPGALHKAKPSLLNGGSINTARPPPEAAWQQPEAEFLGIQGFSARNLWYMRTFYRTSADKAKLQPLVAEIGWSHNLVMLDRCSDDLQRAFY